MGAKAVLTLVSAVVAGIAAVVQWRRRDSPAAAPLAVVMAGGASWALTEVLGDVAPWATVRALAGPALLLAGSVVAAGVVWYALGLTGRTRLLTRRNAALLGVEPVLVAVASATNGAHQLVVVDVPSGRFPGPLFWAHTAYAYGLVLVAVVLLLRAAVRAVPGHRKVLLLVVASMAPPLLGNVVSLVLDAQGVDLTGVLFLVTASLWLWIERSRHRLRRTPISTQQVLQALSDAVVVVDDDGVVVDANEAALALTRRSVPQVVGRPWAEVAGPVVTPGLAGDGRSVVGLPDGRHLDVRITPVRGADGAAVGSVIVARDVTELERLRAELADQALRDPLTGLHNRRRLVAALDELGGGAPADAVDGGRPLVAVMVDIDHFKQVNDRFGHEVGDQVLVAVAEELRRSVRADDVVARVGGEEFALLLPGARTDDAVRRVEDLRARCAALEFPAAPGLRITLSAGVAELDPAAPDVAGLLGRADRGMYRAKAAGRDRVVIAAP